MTEADQIIQSYLNRQDRLRRSMTPEEWESRYAPEHRRVLEQLCRKFNLTLAGVGRLDSENPWWR